MQIYWIFKIFGILRTFSNFWNFYNFIELYWILWDFMGFYLESDLLKLVHFSLYVGQFVILYNFLLHYDFLQLNQNFSQFLVNFHNGVKINRLKIKTPNNYLLPYPIQDQKTVDLTQYLKSVHPGLLWPPPGRLCWTKSALFRIFIYWGLLLSRWDPLASFFTFRK